jgi:hypothetical protein
MLLCFGGLAELLLEHLLVEHPPPGLALADGVLMLLLVLARVLLALHLGAVGDEVARVSVVEATLLLSTMLEGLAVIVEPVDQHTRSSSPSTSTYSSVIGI